MLARTNVKGFSLLELLLVLGVSASLAAGAFLLGARARDRAIGDANETALLSMFSAIQQLHEPWVVQQVQQFGAGFLTTGQAISLKIVPDFLQDGGGLAHHAEGGPLSIQSSAAGAISVTPPFDLWFRVRLDA